MRQSQATATSPFVTQSYGAIERTLTPGRLC